MKHIHISISSHFDNTVFLLVPEHELFLLQIENVRAGHVYVYVHEKIYV